MSIHFVEPVRNDVLALLWWKNSFDPSTVVFYTVLLNSVVFWPWNSAKLQTFDYRSINFSEKLFVNSMQSLSGQSFNKHVNQVETLIFLKLLMQGNGSTEAIVTNDIRRVNSACNRYKRNRNLWLCTENAKLSQKYSIHIDISNSSKSIFYCNEYNRLVVKWIIQI